MLVPYFVIGVCILFGSACVPRKKTVSPQKRLVGVEGEVSLNQKKNKKSFDLDEAVRQEAALIDVPIPLYTSRLSLVANDQYGSHIVLGYHTAMDANELLTFYQNQMEMQGWSSKRVFIGSESLLHFEKPTRACSVSIRPSTTFFGGSSGTDLVIYLEDNKFVW